MPRRPAAVPALPEQFVASPEALVGCVDHLAAFDVLGFDTEFVGEQSFRPELCLIQVSTPERLYLIDPYTSGDLQSFWALLHDPARTVVVHAAREDARVCFFASGQAPGTLFDTQIAAGFLGFSYPISYAGLVHGLLGRRLQKGDTLSDWRRRPLTASQIRYAYDDVRFLLPIHARMMARLTKYERTGWVADECDGYLQWSIGTAPREESWRKVKGSGALGRRELAVLRTAYTWREGVAERQNRPVRSVLRDDGMIELARRGAREPEGLDELRGIPSRELPTLIRLVREAIALPPEEYPEAKESEQDPPQIGVLSSLLNVVLNDVCDRLKLAPSLVCTQQDLKDLVRSRQPGCLLSADSPFRTGWRKEVLWPHLDRILAGGLAVRVNDATLTAPLEYIEPI